MVLNTYSAEIQAMAQAIREREADYDIWQDLPTPEEVEEQQRFMRVLEKRDAAKNAIRVVSGLAVQDETPQKDWRQQD